MDALIDPGEYAALAYCTYLNQASLGLIPRTSVEASVRFLTGLRRVPELPRFAWYVSNRPESHC